MPCPMQPYVRSRRALPTSLRGLGRPTQPARAPVDGPAPRPGPQPEDGASTRACHARTCSRLFFFQACPRLPPPPPPPSHVPLPQSLGAPAAGRCGHAALAAASGGRGRGAPAACRLPRIPPTPPPCTTRARPERRHASRAVKLRPSPRWARPWAAGRAAGGRGRPPAAAAPLTRREPARGRGLDLVTKRSQARSRGARDLSALPPPTHGKRFAAPAARRPLGRGRA
jgi:hypothetical protein